MQTLSRASKTTKTAFRMASPVVRPPSATQPTFPEFWIHNWHSPQVQRGGYGLTLKAGMSKGIEKKLKIKLQCEVMAPTIGDTGSRNKASVSQRQPHPHGHAVYEIKRSICQGMK